MGNYADEVLFNKNGNTQEEKKYYKVYAQVMLEIEAKNKAELIDILENMDYEFTDPRPEERRILDTEIREFTDEDDNPIY